MIMNDLIKKLKIFLIDLEKEFIDEKKDRKIIVEKFLKKLDEVFDEIKKSNLK